MSLDKKGRMACQYHENEDKEWCFRFHGEQIKNIWDDEESLNNKYLIITLENFNKIDELIKEWLR